MRSRQTTLTSMVVLSLAASCSGVTYTVDDDGPADFSSIQAAINATVSGQDEVVVAPGLYNETIDFQGKAITVRSQSGDPSDTIVDGSGAFHVVVCVIGEGRDTVLTGFTITGGQANGDSSPDNSGGGLLNLNSSPTIAHCVFRENGAFAGGGMHNDNSSPLVADCEFVLNGALVGGGMANTMASKPTLVRCTFTDNEAWYGGGMHNGDTSEPLVLNCAFSDNSAIRSGAMANSNSSRPEVLNCIFTHNSADSGGAMSTNDASNPRITNCIFAGNSATAMSGMGGGINNSGASPQVISCTFVGNSAIGNGGGLYNSGSDVALITNCIFWANTPDQIEQGLGSVIVAYSIVAGGFPGPGNLNVDPLLVDAPGPDGVFGTGDDDLHLLPGSPAIDAGLSVAFLFDLDGNRRVVDDPTQADTGIGFPAVIDMGAYEFGSVPVVIGDLNEDGVVDLLDLAILAANWLAGAAP